MAYRLLYADDERPLRELVKDQLSYEGFDVQTAEDGNDAVEKMNSTTFDLVLLDIRMPGLDGIGVLGYLKTQKVRPRVIMVTGVGDVDVALQAVRLGANDFVTKPFELPDLLESIRKVLSR